MKGRKFCSQKPSLRGRFVLKQYIQEEFPQGRWEREKAQAGIYSKNTTENTGSGAILEQNTHNNLRMHPWDPQQIC